MFIIANWKMNGTQSDLNTFCIGLVEALPTLSRTQIILCVPFPYLSMAEKILHKTGVALGAQDCSPHENGAYTGDVSAAMVRDMGCQYVILGHSERRHHHREGCRLIQQKMVRAQTHDLIPIVCVGESDGQTSGAVTRQVRRAFTETGQQALIAYEPLWAIGTGKTATPEIIGQMHAKIIKAAPHIPVLYGGSVNAANVADIIKTQGVSGVLVGGASCSLTTFLPLLRAADTAQTSN